MVEAASDDQQIEMQALNPPEEEPLNSPLGSQEETTPKQRRASKKSKSSKSSKSKKSKAESGAMSKGAAQVMGEDEIEEHSEAMD